MKKEEQDWNRLQDENERLRNQIASDKILDDVHSAMVAMQKSDDIAGLLAAVMSYFNGLMIDERPIIWIAIEMKSQKNWNAWTTSNASQNLADCINIPSDCHRHFITMQEDWKVRKPSVIFVDGTDETDVADWMYLMNQFGFCPEFDNQLAEQKKYFIQSFPFAQGFISITSLTALKDDIRPKIHHLTTLCEHSFSHFLDLKRLEELTREIQVEKALEKVRVKGMAMRHTSVLQDVVNEVAQQLQSIQIPISGGVFITINDDVGIDFPIWGSGGANNYVQKAVVPFLDKPIFINLRNAVKKRKKFLIENYTHAEKIEFFEHLFSHAPWDATPDAFKKQLLSLEGGYVRSVTIAQHSTIFIINNSGEVFSEEANNILKRFGGVFEQFYIRFLDLQLAETQARDAQIETTLERVRSVSMGMHQSEDLYKVIKVVYDQVMQLALPVDVCAIIDDLENTSEIDFWVTNTEISYPEKIKVPFIDLGILNHMRTAYKDRPEFLEMVLNKEEKDLYFRHMLGHADIKNITSKERQTFVFNTPGLNRLISFMTHSALIIDNYQGYTYSDDEKKVVKRMHHVFEQAYVRFLDLQKSEAQAQEIKAMESAKAHMYTNITHEFRTPLTVITGMAEQIKEDPEKYLTEGVSMINRNAQRLLKLVNQMLELRKLESGTIKIQNQQSDILSYIKYITESIHSFAKSRRVQIHFTADENELIMDFDVEKIHQILMNLLSNAIKFTPPEGHVFVAVKRTSRKAEKQTKENLAEIRVRDTGKGISDEHLPFVFDRFYQVDDSPSHIGGGSGIGLSLVRELVHLMGGIINVASKEDQGTEFLIHLPIRNEAIESLPKEIHSVVVSPTPRVNMRLEHPRSKLFDKDKARLVSKSMPRVLLIEDNVDVSVYIASCLQHDYDIQVGKNGQEGIDFALDMIPDLIISDVMMPIKNGFEVCKTLKNDIRTSHVPIVMLTAKTDMDSKLEGLEYGADAYLAKPFHKKELTIRIKKLLESRQKLQEYYLGIASAQQNQISIMETSNHVEVEKNFVERVKNIVEQHLIDSNFTVDQFCREIGMSHSQLRRKLTALTGLSPSGFIRLIRLNKAKILLMNKELNISKIAYAVGFNDPAYFSRVFKKEFGMTPLRFKDAGERSDAK